MRRLFAAAALLTSFALIAPGHAAEPQKFKSEDSATKFCKTGNVVWFNPESKIYFAPGTQFYGKTKAGGYTCKAFAEKSGYRVSK